MKDIFTEIYNNNLWCGSESVSGTGSDLAETQAVIPLLNSIIYNFKINSIGDAPCGDWNWMQHVDLNEVNYLGMDIVEKLIDDNRTKFGSDGVEFNVTNIIDGTLPTVDLFLVRDLFGHLSNDDIKASLKNIVDSGSKYLLTTTFPGEGKYSIESGNWFPINMEHYVSSPIVLFNEGCIAERDVDTNWWNKHLGLWEIDKMEIY